MSKHAYKVLLEVQRLVLAEQMNLKSALEQVKEKYDSLGADDLPSNPSAAIERDSPLSFARLHSVIKSAMLEVATYSIQASISARFLAKRLPKTRPPIDGGSIDDFGTDKDRLYTMVRDSFSRFPENAADGGKRDYVIRNLLGDLDRLYAEAKHKRTR